MPRSKPRSKPRTPPDLPDTTYHVFNRGLGRQVIFFDDLDRREFVQCFRRHLSPVEFVDQWGRPYKKMNDQVSVLAYCLMPNHFHLVLHQLTSDGISRLMHAAMAGYTRYFNRRHGRSGRLCGGGFRAVPKLDPTDAATAILYVHCNNEMNAEYEFCSHNAYMAGELRGEPSVGPPVDWLDIRGGLKIFRGRDEYARRLARYLVAPSRSDDSRRRVATTHPVA